MESLNLLRYLIIRDKVTENRVSGWFDISEKFSPVDQ